MALTSRNSSSMINYTTNMHTYIQPINELVTTTDAVTTDTVNTIQTTLATDSTEWHGAPRREIDAFHEKMSLLEREKKNMFTITTEVDKTDKEKIKEWIATITEISKLRDKSRTLKRYCEVLKEQLLIMLGEAVMRE